MGFIIAVHTITDYLPQPVTQVAKKLSNYFALDFATDDRNSIDILITDKGGFSRYLMW